MDAATKIYRRASPWNKGKLLGQKPPLRLKEIWAIRIRRQLNHRHLYPTGYTLGMRVQTTEEYRGRINALSDRVLRARIQVRVELPDTRRYLSVHIDFVPNLRPTSVAVVPKSTR